LLRAIAEALFYNGATVVERSALPGFAAPEAPCRKRATFDPSLMRRNKPLLPATTPPPSGFYAKLSFCRRPTSARSIRTSPTL
jgi:hypothetical protein